MSRSKLVSTRRLTVLSPSPSVRLPCPYSTGRINTVDLLVLTSSDQLFFILKLYFYFCINNLSQLGRPIVLSLPLQLGFHVLGN